MVGARGTAHPCCNTGGLAVVKRLLFFAYGLMAYLIFLGTFLYASAFVGGFMVPRRLDGLQIGRAHV